MLNKLSHRMLFASAFVCSSVIRLMFFLNGTSCNKRSRLINDAGDIPLAVALNCMDSLDLFIDWMRAFYIFFWFSAVLGF